MLYTRGGRLVQRIKWIVKQYTIYTLSFSIIYNKQLNCYSILLLLPRHSSPNKVNKYYSTIMSVVNEMLS